MQYSIDVLQNERDNLEDKMEELKEMKPTATPVEKEMIEITIRRILIKITDLAIAIAHLEEML